MPLSVSWYAMSELLPFGQYVQITHLRRNQNYLWITNAQESFIKRGNWQYGCRSDAWGSWGEMWYDEFYVRPIEGVPMNRWTEALIQDSYPTAWPPIQTQKIGRRLGIWGSNGSNPNLDLMLSWRPGAITCIYDYLSSNGIEYLKKHTEVPLIIRFLHPQNWMQNPQQSANDLANKVISKWPAIRDLNLDPYVDFANELNLGPESGQSVPALDSREFYQQAGAWITDVAKQIKQAIPEIHLVCPPWAFGHNEDGVPENGIPKIGWAGYDYLADAVKLYFNNILTFHGYWGDGRGCIESRLYDPELSSWYAFRWRRVLELFKIRYGLDCKMIIDECGNMNPAHPRFFEQLQYYAGECLQDGRVIAVTPFLWADPTGFNDINSWVARIPDLEGFCARLAALPDVEITSPAPPQPGPEPEPEPEPPEPTGVDMKIEFKPGPQLIKGNWLHKGQKMMLTYWDNEQVVISGHKGEFGEGGFEFVAYGKGLYILAVEDYEFDIEMPEGVTATLSFTEGEPTEQIVRLVSKPMTRAAAEAIMADYPGLFEYSD